MKKILITIFVLLIGVSAGYYIFNLQYTPFEKLSSEEMHERIIKERDYAIGKAVMAGDFRCCISPPCTMCYMEANQWNNNTPGTCACDDLIAEGKEPCPQCKRGLEQIHSEDNTYCDINADVSTCGSNNK